MDPRKRLELKIFFCKKVLVKHSLENNIQIKINNFNIKYHCCQNTLHLSTPILHTHSKWKLIK